MLLLKRKTPCWKVGQPNPPRLPGSGKNQKENKKGKVNFWLNFFLAFADNEGDAYLLVPSRSWGHWETGIEISWGPFFFVWPLIWMWITCICNWTLMVLPVWVNAHNLCQQEDPFCIVDAEEIE